MQIKDQRITNIKQKFGQKFEPIMFTRRRSTWDRIDLRSAINSGRAAKAGVREHQTRSTATATR